MNFRLPGEIEAVFTAASIAGSLALLRPAREESMQSPAPPRTLT
jgi:hypothetical protein